MPDGPGAGSTSSGPATTATGRRDSCPSPGHRPGRTVSWLLQPWTRSSPTPSSIPPRVRAPSPPGWPCPGFGSWALSHGGIYNVLRRAGLHRRSARLAAAEALAATEGGPITERALREIRAREVTRRHIGSDVPGEQVFLDTMCVGHLKGVGKVWQYSAVDGACSLGFATVLAGEKSA